MAKKRRATRVEPAPKADLTPMIDIVFNLIIFFMIVSELSNLEIEQITLPYADKAEKEPPPQRTGMGSVDTILQINVLPPEIDEDGNIEQPSLIKVRGELLRFLEVEASGYPREDPIPGADVDPSTMRVNIRADKDAPFRYVLEVFESCIENGVYRTSLAATKDEPTR
jgi:biopolymer transport protein ExbD